MIGGYALLMGKSGMVNQKAQAGRERKAAHKELKKQKELEKKEELEAEKWQIGAKVKTAKQVQDEEKRLEKMQKKAEKLKLEAEEAAQLEKYKKLNSKKPSNEPIVKEPSKETIKQSSMSEITLDILGENTNDIEPVYSASNVDDALFLLETATGSTSSLCSGGGGGVKVERHPERRMKAAYAAYEERELPLLKDEFPGLRLGQLREKCMKRWQKAPENPFNQTFVAHNATKSQEILTLSKDVEAQLERLKFDTNSHQSMN